MLALSFPLMKFKYTCIDYDPAIFSIGNFPIPHVHLHFIIHYPGQITSPLSRTHTEEQTTITNEYKYHDRIVSLLSASGVKAYLYEYPITFQKIDDKGDPSSYCLPVAFVSARRKFSISFRARVNRR